MCRRFGFEMVLGVGAKTVEAQGQCTAFYEVPLGEGQARRSTASVRTP